jgi:hypothetical protein
MLRSSTHEEVDRLLPWFANGTLEAAERAAVERHLAECDRCRREAERCRSTTDAVAELEEVAPQPHPAQLARLLRRIDELEAAGGPAPSRLTEMGRRLRASLSLAAWKSRRAAGVGFRWILATQLAVVALLALLLVRIDSQRDSTGTTDDVPAAATTPFQTLSDTPDGPGSSAADGQLLRVVFAQDLTEGELRAMLLEQELEIVGGPSPFGVYTLSAPDDGPHGGAAGALDWLRASPGVRFAEPLAGSTAP